MRFHAPYLEWAKQRPAAAFDLAGSNVLACAIDDLPGAREALALNGRNDDGYAPLVDAIASRYGVDARQVIVTSDDHTRAVPLRRETDDRLRAQLCPVLEAGRVPVLGGFVGATRDGHTSTLGRGGVSSGRNQRIQMRPRGWPHVDTQFGRPGSRCAITIVHEPSGSYSIWPPLIVTRS